MLKQSPASGFTELFRAAKEGSFVFHKDIPRNMWNVFQIVNGEECYLVSFNTPQAAHEYCDKANRLGEELPYSCYEFVGDNANCPAHGVTLPREWRE